MANEYSASAFRKVLFERLNGALPKCSICGGNSFTTPDDYTSLLSQNDFSNLSIGRNVPAAMIVCKQCGHIEFFSLGILGLLKKPEKEGE